MRRKSTISLMLFLAKLDYFYFYFHQIGFLNPLPFKFLLYNYMPTDACMIVK